MKFNISFYIILLAITGLSVTGCKKYLDVNDNPNIARNIQPELLLPSAQINLTNSLGKDLQIHGSFWAQYWTQSPTASQYKSIDQYTPSGNDFDRVWGLMYDGELTDLKQMERVAIVQNKSQYVAIAKLLKAYTFQVITDGWGDIPYSQALRGAPEDGGITSPRFDAQQVIYDSLIAEVNEGLALINAGDPGAPGIDDLVFGGDMTMWEKFGNTLKLRLYLRLAYADPAKAQAGVSQLMSSGASFLDIGEDAKITYSQTPGNQNPLYGEALGLNRTQNIVGSATVIDSMNSNDDPRREVLFTSLAGGLFSGLTQGDFNAPTTTPVSVPTPITGAYSNDVASAAAPVMLLTGYESKFLQAEAVARGWATGDAQALFEDGIMANFTTYGIPDSAASYIANAYWGQFPTSGTVAQKLRHIITQKWFSMTSNQGFEAWTEWRRTGYPDFLIVSVASLIGGNGMPQRLFYPNDELTSNANFPGQPTITAKVWWDKN